MTLLNALAFAQGLPRIGAMALTPRGAGLLLR